MLAARALSKRYDREVVLKDLSLTVQRGEIYCLLGPNGAGKTTTISLFLGLIAPSSGSVTIDQIDMSRAPVAAKRRLAYVPENVAVYNHLTARQNLEFFARLSGVPTLARPALHDMLASVGLPESAFEKRVGKFSKGMRQRLGLSIALAKGASGLLLDEPTSGLDPHASADFLVALDRLRNGGAAVLMSTHDLLHAQQIADRVGIMRNGVLLCERRRSTGELDDPRHLYSELVN